MLYSWVQPAPVAAPRLIAHSPEVASLLGMDPAYIALPEFAQVFGGNALLEGMQPYAAVYGGHQFGDWAGQLGDGRAINLGEVINRRGERWILQLKGAGPTPYSRNADGLAVLRSSIREFLCSEEMHHLGIPTTRSLAVTATGDPVFREETLPGAVLTRVAASHLRVGTIQWVAVHEDRVLLQAIVYYTLRRHFPDRISTTGPEAPYDFTWAFLLVPAGGDTTRLIIRERYRYRATWVWLVIEPVAVVSFVMTERMLRGIRDRAER